MNKGTTPAFQMCTMDVASASLDKSPLHPVDSRLGIIKFDIMCSCSFLGHQPTNDDTETYN